MNGTSVLAGRVVVVAGGAGLVGRHVVRALVEAGARVLVPTRRDSPGAQPEDEERGASEADDRRVRTVTVRDWADPHELRAVAQEPGWRPDAAVASVGGWWIGTELVDLDVATWRALVESHLTGHFLVARALAPLVAPADDAVYVALNGAAAREPMALSGPVSVTGAAQTMLLEVLRRESVGRTVRFHEVSVLAAVAGDERNLDPERTVPGARVGAAVVGVLADARSPARVDVL